MDDDGEEKRLQQRPLAVSVETKSGIHPRGDLQQRLWEMPPGKADERPKPPPGHPAVLEAPGHVEQQCS